MNSTLWKHMAMTFFVAAVLPFSTAAQTSAVNHTHHHYQVMQIPTLGGSQTNFFDNTNNIAVVNGRGTVSGGCAETSLSDPNGSMFWWTADGNVCHAFLWQNGSLTDLGSLAGTNNSGAAWISSNGIVAGLSENGQIDPSISGLPEISAVMWRNGAITNLGTLPGGGYQSAAVSVNSRGEVAGIASNLVPDSNSLLNYNPNLWSGVGYGYQLRAFFWDQKNGMLDLGTLGGTDAQVTMINERGQVIGDSYISSDPGVCSDSPQKTGAFIWDRQHGMVDLGSFGGTCTEPADLNNHGQVAGGGTVANDAYQRAFLWQSGTFSDLGGSLGGNNTGAIALNENGAAVGFAYLSDGVTFHATLWRGIGKMTDLGTVGSDPCSFAQGVNDEAQVVGDSTPSTSNCQNFDTSRGFLWENGSIADLNALVPASSPLYIIFAYTINNRGEIAVNGIDGNGIEQAALLIPCDGNHAGVEGCDYSMVDAAATTRENPAGAIQQPATTSPRTLRPSGRRGLAFRPRQIGANTAGSTRSLTSTLAVTDRAADDPQIASLSGTDVPKCTVQGHPCGLVPCCPGLVCMFRGGSTRAGYACYLKGSVNTSRTGSFWDGMNTNKLDE
jgi:probable HAF family extracellular repeat protein